MSESGWAQALYYAGWFAMFVVESVAWATCGVLLGAAVFVAGGVAWGSWQAAHTSPHEPLRGPILRTTKRLVDAGQRLGFVGAVVVGGPPGVAAAVAAGDRDDVARTVLVASILYAAIWVAFHVLRPQGALPMHWGPRLP